MNGRCVCVEESVGTKAVVAYVGEWVHYCGNGAAWYHEKPRPLRDHPCEAPPL